MSVLAGLRQLGQTSLGRNVAVGLLIVGVLAAVVSVWTSFRGNPDVAAANDPFFVCSKTGKSWRHQLKDGEQIPIYSPYSKENTGYVAELCYWTADGNAKKDPTPVLLNERVGLPGATFCPECGRLVTSRNPPPGPGVPVPPTRQEYEARRPRPAGAQ